MSTLSDRQRRIIQFIIAFFSENEFPPTIREIGERVGISSTSVVNYNLAKLEDLGLISRHREVSRGLSLNWERLVDMNLTAPNLASQVIPSLPGHGANGGVAPDMLRVPILGSIAAGEPISVEAREASNPEGWVELPEGFVSSRVRKNRDHLFALRVKGDSMIDASVLDGDIVILRHQETANDGDMVAAWIEGDEETTLKYFYHEGRNIRLQPANPNPVYQPIIRPAERVRINGRVVSVLRMVEQ